MRAETIAHRQKHAQLTVRNDYSLHNSKKVFMSEQNTFMSVQSKVIQCIQK